MITTTLGGSLQDQLIQIASLEKVAEQEQDTTVYLNSDISKDYQEGIFKYLNRVDILPADVLNKKLEDMCTLTIPAVMKELLLLSPEAIKEVDDPITTAICMEEGNDDMIDYYQRAMDFIGESAFIFISDDIEWCKEHFTGENIFYSPLTNEIEQLSLIARCSNVILSKTIFGYWGAFLGETVYSKIVLPADFDHNQAPSSWHRI